MTNDRRRLTIPGSVSELLERGINSVVLTRIHAKRSPAVGLEYRFEVRHRENRLCGNVELAVILVYKYAKVIQVLCRSEHNTFPDGTLLQFSISDHAVRIETRAHSTLYSKTWGDREALPHGPGCDLDTG